MSLGDVVFRERTQQNHSMKSPKLSLALLLLLLGVPAMMSAGTGRRGHRVSVSITPSSSTLQVGQSQQFTAKVSNTANTAVNWLVNGVLGGNSSVGTVSSAGLYHVDCTIDFCAGYRTLGRLHLGFR